MKHCLLNDKCVVVVTSRGTHTNTTVLWPFFLDFLVQEKINRGRHTDCPAGHHSIWTKQCQHPPSPHLSGQAVEKIKKQWQTEVHVESGR